jgi:hypothetical protein
VRRHLPTLVSFRQSRAFQPGKAGCIFDHATCSMGEPCAEERELAMGYEPSSTAAVNLSDGDRCRVLGQAIDEAPWSRWGTRSAGKRVEVPSGPLGPWSSAPSAAGLAAAASWRWQVSTQITYLQGAAPEVPERDQKTTNRSLRGFLGLRLSQRQPGSRESPAPRGP